MTKGDTILVLATGETEEVMAVYPSMVVTYESDDRGTWYHPTKVRKA